MKKTFLSDWDPRDPPQLPPEGHFPEIVLLFTVAVFCEPVDSAVASADPGVEGSAPWHPPSSKKLYIPLQFESHVLLSNNVESDF